MPAAATAPAPTKPTAPPAKPPTATAAPEPKVSFDDALSKLAATRRVDVESALTIYRAHGLAIADGKPLSDAEYAALSHAIQSLGITHDDLRRDVQAVILHRGQVAALADARATVDKLTAESKTWGDEEAALKRKLHEIACNRGRLHAAGILSGSLHGELHSTAGSSPRLLGTFAVAVEAVLAPKTSGAYVPRVIRNEPVQSDGPLPHNPGPFLGTLG